MIFIFVEFKLKVIPYTDPSCASNKDYQRSAHSV